MSSFFTIPYIAFLGLILLLISGVYIFLVKRMANQNHQFSSIVGVVTSLADELNRLKEFISTTLINKPKEIQLTKNELIQVSDDEVSSDTEDVSDSDSDSDSYPDSDPDSEEENKPEIKYIQITSSIKDENIQLDNKTIQLIDENNNLDDKLIDENNNLDDKLIQLNELIEETHLDENINLDNEKNISLSEESDQNTDYKKLSLSKLRSIVVEKGLVEDASKLKKPALLQLLEQNN